MDEKDLAIERITSAYERINKRVWILCIIIFLVCAGTNIGWLYYESQFNDEVTTKIRQENQDGYNNYIGNDGDITNGNTDD